MPAHKAPAIHLSPDHEAALNELVRAHSTPQKLAERARIILLAAAGKGMDDGRRTRRMAQDGAPLAPALGGGGSFGGRCRPFE